MEINLDYQVCRKMPKADKVDFHFDNSKDDLILNLTQETHDKTSSNNWAKIDLILKTCEIWNNEENDISSKLGECKKICGSYHQMKNWTSW